MSAAVKEPLFHIVKRDNTTFVRSTIIRAIAIVLSLLVCSVVIVLVTGMNPLDVYAEIWKGAMGTSRRIWTTLRDAAVLLCISFAVLPAFKMRFWNIGAEGQVLVGAMATAAVLIYCRTWPSWMVYALCPLAAVAAGMIWGAIPAFFKAHWNTNETLFTLMLNYIATQLMAFAVLLWENPKGSNHIDPINQKTKLGWLPDVAGNKFILLILIVGVLMVALHIYMSYTKQGYEIAVVGESENTAHYAGINVKRVILRTMAISGAIGGLAGYLITSGVDHTVATTTAGGRGFTAIIVAWLAKLNPFAMFLVSFFLVFMEKGAKQIAGKCGLNESASDILTGIILFFILGCEFFIAYRVEFRKNAREEVKA